MSAEETYALVPVVVRTKSGEKIKVFLEVEEKLRKPPEELPPDDAFSSLVEKANYYLAKFNQTLEALARVYRASVVDKLRSGDVTREEEAALVGTALLYGSAILGDVYKDTLEENQINPVVENLLYYILEVLRYSNLEEAEEAIEAIEEYLSVISGQEVRIEVNKVSSSLVADIASRVESKLKASGKAVCDDGCGVRRGVKVRYSGKDAYRFILDPDSVRGSRVTGGRVVEVREIDEIEGEATTEKRGAYKAKVGTTKKEVKLGPNSVGTPEFETYEARVVEKVARAIEKLAEENKRVRDTVKKVGKDNLRRIIRDALRAEGAKHAPSKGVAQRLVYGPDVPYRGEWVELEGYFQPEALKSLRGLGAQIRETRSYLVGGKEVTYAVVEVPAEHRAEAEQLMLQEAPVPEVQFKESYSSGRYTFVISGPKDYLEELYRKLEDKNIYAETMKLDERRGIVISGRFSSPREALKLRKELEKLRDTTYQQYLSTKGIVELK